jgi:hypothetical protein
MYLPPNVIQFIQSASRNKIVFCHKLIDGIDFVNVGRDLSLQIIGKSDFDDLQGEVNRTLSRTSENTDIGRYLALYNIGILFEPELKLNLRSILDNYSKDQTLFICDEGQVVDGIFHFFEPSSLFSVDLTGMAFIIIE